MATNGSFTGKTSNQYITSKIEWSAIQNEAGNYSDVSATLFYKKSSSSTSATSGTLKCSLSIGGDKKSDEIPNFRIPTNNTYQEAVSHTVRVYHDPDGSKEITITCSGYISGSSLESTTCEDTVRLTDIPRKSTITATSANVGESCRIAIKRAASSFVHTLLYSFGELSGTIVEKTDLSSIDWVLPSEFYKEMTSVKSKTGLIECITYSNDEEIGRSNASFTARVSEENAPEIYPDVFVSEDSDTYKLTGDTKMLIRNFTYPSWKFNASAKNGATIVSYKVVCGDMIGTSESGQFSGPVNTENVTFTVVDSRGFSKTYDYVMNLVDYVRLTCNADAKITGNGVATLNVNGNYFNGSFGKVRNSLNVYYRYKVNSNDYGDWSPLNLTIKGNTYTSTLTLNDLDYRNLYTIQVWATDAFYSNGINEGVYSRTIEMSAFPLFDWGENDFKFNKYVNFGSGTSLHPVGSIHITRENKNPSEYLGGTWELLKKRMSNKRADSSSFFFSPDSNNVSGVGNSTMERLGYVIRIRLNLVLSSSLSDDTMNLGTIDFNYLGFSSLAYTLYVSGYTDTGNGIAQCSIAQDTGNITCLDVVTKSSGGSIASGNTLIIDIVIVPPSIYILDEECDEFVWERTA